MSVARSREADKSLRNRMPVAASESTIHGLQTCKAALLRQHTWSAGERSHKPPLYRYRVQAPLAIPHQLWCMCRSHIGRQNKTEALRAMFVPIGPRTHVVTNLQTRHKLREARSR